MIALNRGTLCETIADWIAHEVAETVGAPDMKKVSGLRSVNGPVMYISHHGPQRTGGPEIIESVSQGTSRRVRAHVLALRIRGALGSAIRAHLGNSSVMFAMGSTT